MTALTVPTQVMLILRKSPPAGSITCPECDQVGNPWALSLVGHRFDLGLRISLCPSPIEPDDVEDAA